MCVFLLPEVHRPWGKCRAEPVRLRHAWYIDAGRRPDGADRYPLVEDTEAYAYGLVYAATNPGLGYGIGWDLAQREELQEMKSKRL